MTQNAFRICFCEKIPDRILVLTLQTLPGSIENDSGSGMFSTKRTCQNLNAFGVEAKEIEDLLIPRSAGKKQPF